MFHRLKTKRAAEAALSLAWSTVLRGAWRLACMPLAHGAETQAPQITKRLFQVFAFKRLSVYQLTILPFNYLYSAVLAALQM
jgi:hypothetical protein